MEFVFEKSPWEQALEALQPGDALSAVHALTLLESEDEQGAEDALTRLEEYRITLDITDLPVSAGIGETAVRLRQEAQLVKSGTLLESLEETDPLRLYLEEVAQTPAAGDMQLLAQTYAAGDEAAAEKLTNLMLSRVIEEASALAGRGVLLMDLIQEGSMGLWQSVLNYETGDFESQAIWWIRQYLAKAVTLQARANGVGQRMRRAVEDYRSVDERLLSELGRNPTPEELAQALHMSVSETMMVADMLENARNMNRLKPAEPDEELPQEEDQAVEDTAYFQMRQRISELLSTLSEREAKLLNLRFGLEGGLPLKPREAGARLGLTAEEAVALEAAALAKLRKQ